MSLTSLRLPAPAKLNLFLHVTGAARDGFTNLQTLCFSFRLAEHAGFHPARRQSDSVCTATNWLASAPKTISDTRAARLLQQHTGQHHSGADIIPAQSALPMGGGLAAVARMQQPHCVGLNHLWQDRRFIAKHCHAGLAAWRDVPVFVLGRAAWRRRGLEELTPVEAGLSPA